MNDIQPYLDYFTVLRTYVEQGLLEVLPAAHEAYITAPALYTLSYADALDEMVQHAELTGDKREHQRLNAELFQSLVSTTDYLRIYAEYLNAAEEGFKLYQQASELAKDMPATSTAVEQAAENMRKPQVVNGKDQMVNGQWSMVNGTFALHVVSDKHPHPLLYTILATKQRRWYAPWKETDHYEVITY
jgi:hypothetical protein